MANSNFVVQNGLTVGPLTIDAATGSISTTGTVSITGGLAVSQISKNDSIIAINDTGVSGSNVQITIDGTVEHTIDANGVNLTTGDGYSINGASVLTATTLGSGVVNSSLTSLGVITSLGATTAVATNFSTGNAVITGGSANGLTTLAATTAVATNFSTGNAVITGGSINNAAIGATTASTGRFTTLTTTGDATIAGNLTVNGTTTTINSTVVTVDDILIELGNVASPTDVTAAGGGIVLQGTTNKSITWGATNGWTSTEDFNVASGKIYRINGTSVLSATTLGSGVTASSLTSVGTLTGLTVSGNTAHTSTVYAQGIYDNSNRVLSTTTGAGNLAISGTQVTLSATGPGAASVGSSTAIPVITTDAYGRVSSTSTAAVIAPAGTLSGSTLNATVTASSLTSVGTLTSLSVSGAITVNSGNGVTAIVNGGTAGTGNIGASGQGFNTIFAKATSAQYADIAENYQGDRQYNPGTVVMFGGAAEVTLATPDTTRVAGVVSTNPAMLMNGALSGSNVVPVAFTGRVPCMVIGPVQKGDIMVSAGFGYAKVNNTPQIGTIIGKALEDYPMEAKGVIEVVVGRF